MQMVWLPEEKFRENNVTSDCFAIFLLVIATMQMNVSKDVSDVRCHRVI